MKKPTPPGRLSKLAQREERIARREAILESFRELGANETVMTIVRNLDDAELAELAFFVLAHGERMRMLLGVRAIVHSDAEV